MIKLEEQELDTNIPHRRRGNAFDTLANVFRNVKELVFRNSFVMRNRPSKITNSSNVFEMYADNDTTNDSNFIYIGRSGGESLNRNMGYVEITANSSTAEKDMGIANGVVLLVISKDKTVNRYGQIAIADASAISSANTGTVSIINGEGDGTTGDIGGAYMSYKNNSNGNIQEIIINKSGIQMIGLPTSSSGLATGTIWRDGTTLRIVA